MASDVIGKIIAGCRVTDLIGQGGMGLVYKAHHIALDQDRAVKVMDPFIAQDAVFMRRFSDEAKSLASVHSPYIVVAHDLCETEIGTCLIMEYVKGRTLAEIIRDSSGPLDEHRTFHLFKQILLALEHAHGAKVIHRDIKPGNILVTANDDVKVTDFGLAKMQEPGSATVTQLTGGTIYYMSPEQLQNKVDHRADLWSLGMTLYETLTGTVPFEKTDSDFGIREKIVRGKIPPPKSRNPRISENLNAFVMKAIAHDPDRRFQSAAEMRVALEKIEREPVNPVKVKKTFSWSEYRRIAIPLGATLLVVVGIYFFASRDQMRSVLIIRSVPQGAQVSIDGAAIGQTPIVRTSSASGPVKLGIQKQGYESKETLLVLNTGDSIRLMFSLGKIKLDTNHNSVKLDTQYIPLPEPQLALLDVTSKPAGAEVYVDRILRKGIPPFKIEPGRHTIKIVSGSNQWEKQIRLKAGKAERLVVDFSKTIWLTVVVFESPDTTKSIRGCKVIVDGVEVASSTPKRIPVSFGTHTIMVSHPEHGQGLPVVETIEKDMKLKFVLKK